MLLGAELHVAKTVLIISYTIIYIAVYILLILKILHDLNVL